MKITGLKGVAITWIATALYLLQAHPAAAATWTKVNTSLGQRVVMSAAYGDNSFTNGSGQVVKQWSTPVITIRNADTALPIKITGLRFYSASGVLVKSLLASPLTILPLRSARYQINPALVGVNPYPPAQAACTMVLEWLATTTTKVAVPIIGSTLFQYQPSGNGAYFLTATDTPSTVVLELVP